MFTRDLNLHLLWPNYSTLVLILFAALCCPGCPDLPLLGVASKRRSLSSFKKASDDFAPFCNCPSRTAVCPRHCISLCTASVPSRQAAAQHSAGARRQPDKGNQQTGQIISGTGLRVSVRFSYSTRPCQPDTDDRYTETVPLLSYLSTVAGAT